MPTNTLCSTTIKRVDMKINKAAGRTEGED